MNLLVKMLNKRLLLTLAAVAANVINVGTVLWWNAKLSEIINTGSALTVNIIVSAVIILVVMCAANYLKTYISGFTCEVLTHDLRMGYARYFSELPVQEIEKLNAGEQLSKLQNEISDVSVYLSGNLFQMLSVSISFVFTFAWLLILNTKLTLAVNLPVLIIMIYVFYGSKVISNATERSQQAKGRMNQYADTLLMLFPIIKLYSAENVLIKNFSKEVVKWEEQTSRAERIRARLMSLSGLLSSIPLMLLFLIGGGMAVNGALTIGTLYIFLNLSGEVSGVMMNMPGYIAAFRQFSVNMERLSPKIIIDRRTQ